MELC
jgi:hypothetical protein